MVILSRIDRQVNELIKILEKQKWTSIEFLTVGYVTLNITLYKPKYKYITKGNYIQLYDKISNNRVRIDIYTATDICINEQEQIYEIQLYNNQYIKLKIY